MNGDILVTVKTPPTTKINENPAYSQSFMGCDGGNGNENVTWKYNFISFVLLRDYFNSLNFYRNGELSRNQIGRSGIQVKKHEERKWKILRAPFSKKPRI